MLIPSAENILANGTALTLDKESLVEVKNLKDTTVYVVAAAAKMGDQIGNVVSVEIKTGAYDGVLNIIEATQSVISYHIKPTSDSRYYHLAIPKGSWDYQIEGESASEAERIKTAMLKQLGSVDRGEKTYTLTDGEKDVHKNLTQVFPATEYLLVKADCDAEGNLTSALDTLTFETAENSVSAAEITVELSRITSSGVTIRCVPGAILNRYYIGIEETAVVNQYIEKYGKEAWKRGLMAGSQPFEHTRTRPSTTPCIPAESTTTGTSRTCSRKISRRSSRRCLPSRSITSLRTTDRDAIRTTLFSSISRRPMRT